MSHASQKQCSKNMAIARLRDINQPLEDISKFAEHGGRMPARLRNMLKTAISKNQAVINAFQEWQP